MPLPKKSFEAQLDATFERVAQLDVGEIELRADFARYLCVLVSGYLDQTVRDLTGEFVRHRSHPVVADLVVKLTDRTTNFKAQKLRDHVLMIDPSWEAQIDVLIGDKAKGALDSVIALRHRIAHGQSADVTVARIKEYYVEIKKLISALRTIMGLG